MGTSASGRDTMKKILYGRRPWPQQLEIVWTPGSWLRATESARHSLSRSGGGCHGAFIPTVPSRAHRGPSRSVSGLARRVLSEPALELGDVGARHASPLGDLRLTETLFQT